MQRLELLLMLMLVRHRQPLSETVGSGKRTALGAAVMSLPSGLLVIVGEALTKLESRLKARVSVVWCMPSLHRPALSIATIIEP
jgi:hypothetical protein